MKNTKKNHVVSLHGSYFSNNYGDILLINIFCQWVRDLSPSLQINLPLVDKKHIMEMPEPSLVGFVNFLRSDCLVFVGGGYFGEQPKRKGVWSIRNFLRHGIIGLTAVALKKPIAIIGVEIGPLSKRWFRQVVLKIVRSSTVVIVRNEESVEFLLKHGITNTQLTADAVLTLNNRFVKTEQSGSEYVIMHIPGYASFKNEIETLIRAVCEGMTSNGIGLNKILFMEDIPGQYSDLYSPIYDLVRSYGITYQIKKYIGTKDVIETIKNSTAVFTTKLHVGITAAAYNKKVFSAYAHPKTQRFHHQIGNDRNCVSLKNICNNKIDIKSKVKDFLLMGSFSLPPQVLASANRNKIVLEAFIRSCITDLE